MEASSAYGIGYFRLTRYMSRGERKDGKRLNDVRIDTSRDHYEKEKMRNVE